MTTNQSSHSSTPPIDLVAWLEDEYADLSEFSLLSSGLKYEDLIDHVFVQGDIRTSSIPAELQAGSNADEYRRRMSVLNRIAEKITSPEFASATANYRDGYGQTLLHQIVGMDKGLSLIVRALLEKGAIADILDPGCQLSPLHWAVVDPVPFVLETLINIDLNINLRDGQEGQSPLAALAAARLITPLWPRAARMLLAAGADPNQCGDDGLSPLTLAATKRSSDVLVLDPERPRYSFQGWEYASERAKAMARTARLEFVSVLLESGARTDVYTTRCERDWSRTPISRSIVPIREALGLAAVEHAEAGESPEFAGVNPSEPCPLPAPGLLSSTRPFEIGRLVAQLEGIRDIRHGDDYRDGHAANAALLVEDVLHRIRDCHAHGADILERNENLETALHWAAERGPSKLVRTLLDLGAWPDLVDRQGNTAAHRCIMGQNYYALLEMIDYCESTTSVRFSWSQANNAGDTLLAMLARAHVPAAMWVTLFDRLWPRIGPDWRALVILALRDPACTASHADAPANNQHEELKARVHIIGRFRERFPDFFENDYAYVNDVRLDQWVQEKGDDELKERFRTWRSR